ncbi:MAG: tRNA/rRNA methyltransferase [Salinivirgaceae bacterium]
MDCLQLNSSSHYSLDLLWKAAALSNGKYLFLLTLKEMRMELIFILVEPAVPENIGAAARALKTMGFDQLRLVNTRQHKADQAQWLAHGSTDILDKARVFDSLEQALEDVDFSLGTTAKYRSVKFDYYTPEEALQLSLQKGDSIHKVGIVFGREDSGLTNSELQRCDLAVTIPIKTSYPSLNLAQAVMLMAYVFADFQPGSKSESLQPSDFDLLKTKAAHFLNKAGIGKEENLYGRIMERLASANKTDTHLLLSFMNKLEKKLG